MTKKSAFAHLDINDVRESYDMYRSGELSATEILQLFDVKLAPSTIITAFPNFPTETKCPLCDGLLLIIPTGKTKTQQYSCDTCDHRLIGDAACAHCACEHCEAGRERIAVERERVLNERYEQNLATIKMTRPVPAQSISYKDLSIIDKIYMCALIPLGDAKLLPSRSIAASKSTLSPMGALDDMIFTNLLQNNLISPALDELPRDIVLHCDEQQIDFFQRFHCNVQVDGNASISAVYEKIDRDLKSQHSLSKADVEILCQLSRAIEKCEAIDYMMRFCDEANLPAPPQKTYDIINKYLGRMSVSELAPHLYKCVKDAAYFFVTGKSKGRTHASNTIPNSLERNIEYHKAQGWTTNKWTRHKYSIKSNIASVLYDKFLPSLDLGFHKSNDETKKLICSHFGYHDEPNKNIEVKNE